MKIGRLIEIHRVSYLHDRTAIWCKGGWWVSSFGRMWRIGKVAGRWYVRRLR